MAEITKIFKILKETYPNAKIVLKYGNNWELLAAVILSAQCTDVKVNEVTSRLFPKYRVLVSTRLPRSPLRGGLAMTDRSDRQEIENFAMAPIEELERDIRATGFYRNKAKNIRGAAKMILEKFGGAVPRTIEEMLAIPGVARKTANVVLGNAYGVVAGIAVDTHVLRLSQRLRLVSLDKIGGGKRPLVIPARAGIYISNLNRFRIKSGMTVDYYKDAIPEKIELELMNIIPKKDWFNLTYWLIDHGRAICKAQKPDCKNCPLNKLCPVSRVF